MLVAILMGSDSDWPQLEPAAALLREFGIEFEARVMSAHRSPERVREYVCGATGRGVSVIIAAAGGAAHLAGVVAAHTTLPVIGVPIETKLAGGLDSLLSMVQMPGGVPVATVAIGPAGAKNAAVLAAQIIALSDARVRERLAQYKQDQARETEAKDARLQGKIGGAGG